jgi:hypothetical protein
MNSPFPPFKRRRGGWKKGEEEKCLIYKREKLKAKKRNGRKGGLSSHSLQPPPLRKRKKKKPMDWLFHSSQNIIIFPHESKNKTEAKRDWNKNLLFSFLQYVVYKRKNMYIPRKITGNDKRFAVYYDASRISMDFERKTKEKKKIRISSCWIRHFGCAFDLQRPQREMARTAKRERSPGTNAIIIGNVLLFFYSSSSSSFTASLSQHSDLTCE